MPPRHGAARGAADVGVVGEIGDERNQPAVDEHRHRHVDVGQMRAAGHVRVVGDEEVAFGDVVAVARDQDAHQLEQGGQVDRQRHLRLGDQPTRAHRRSPWNGRGAP